MRTREYGRSEVVFLCPRDGHLFCFCIDYVENESENVLACDIEKVVGIAPNGFVVFTDKNYDTMNDMALERLALIVKCQQSFGKKVGSHQNISLHNRGIRVCTSGAQSFWLQKDQPISSGDYVFSCCTDQH